MNKCKNKGCNNERANFAGPKEKIFSIPFTLIEIRIWNWKHNLKEEYCKNCLIEMHYDREREQFENVIQAAYEKTMIDLNIEE